MGTHRLKTFRITDYLIPSFILRNEAISKVIYEDGVSFKVPDLVNEVWVGVQFNDQDIIACYRVHQFTSVSWIIHAHVLPDFREYSVGCTFAATKWCFDNISNIQSLITHIPEIYPNVMRHIEAIGCIHSGTVKKSFVKNGKLIDQELYVIDKKRLEEFNGETETKDD